MNENTPADERALSNESEFRRLLKHVTDKAYAVGRSGDNIFKSRNQLLAESHAADEKLVDYVRAAQGAGTAPVGANVIEMLLDVVRLAYDGMDGTEENEHGLVWDRASFDALSAAMDKLEELPDDQPGYVMGPAAKAAWALQKVLATPPAPVSTAAATTASASRDAMREAWQVLMDAGVIPGLAPMSLAEGIRAALAPSRAADGQQGASRAALDDDATAKWAEQFGAQVAWANDPDMHHLIRFTPPELRAALARAQSDSTNHKE